MICCLYSLQESLLKENTQKELGKTQLEVVTEQTDGLQREVNSPPKGLTSHAVFVSNCIGAVPKVLSSLFLSGSKWF